MTNIMHGKVYGKVRYQATHKYKERVSFTENQYKFILIDHHYLILKHLREMDDPAPIHRACEINQLSYSHIPRLSQSHPFKSSPASLKHNYT